MGELAYSDELQAAADTHPDQIVYVPTISRPDDPKNANWKGQTGRVSSLWQDVTAKHNLSAADTVAYACGHPGMVKAIDAEMTAANYTVHTEKFWSE